MKVQLIPSEFSHLETISKYNDNYYKAKNGNMFIFVREICNENYEFFEYYLVDDKKEVFLGCSKTIKGLSGNEIVNIDFLYYHT
jgi:hypothetical protein